MIEEIKLRGLGVIAEATLPIGPGFTAVTGETGAGKTMVVTGLGMLLGQRTDSATVRTGADHASASGIWLVPAHGDVAERVADAGGELEPASDDAAELYISRTVNAAGRSRASVGGHAVPAGVLSTLAEHLVVVHGQSEQLRLRSTSAQRDALDRYAGEPVASALDEYQRVYDEFLAIDAELTELVSSRDARAAEADDLRAALAEIEEVAPEPEEDVTLARRAERLSNADELRLAAATAHEALSSENESADVSGLLAEARRVLERAGDPTLTDLAAQLADLEYRAIDVAGAVSGYLADLDDTGPHELAAVEERRAQLATLIRSHGSLQAAIDLLATGSDRLLELDDDGDRVERLSARRDSVSRLLDERADALTTARKVSASALGEAASEELHALAMPDATLSVEVAPAEGTRSGRDEVTILLAPHPGAPARSVSKGASGGELSRVMLALEVVIAATDPVPTFVFDEVDAGIGGAAAIEVGRRLARLAERSQVIAVTHLAQVAAFANNHLTVVKESDGSVTASSVRVLTGGEREAEMARLLSGLTDSDAALTHARELLEMSATP